MFQTPASTRKLQNSHESQRIEHAESAKAIPIRRREQSYFFAGGVNETVVNDDSSPASTFERAIRSGLFERQAPFLTALAEVEDFVQIRVVEHIDAL